MSKVTPFLMFNDQLDAALKFCVETFPDRKHLRRLPALDGTGSSEGIFGWSGYHNTHFWIDYDGNIYGLFMTRTGPYSWEIQKQFRAAVYRGLN